VLLLIVSLFTSGLNATHIRLELLQKKKYINESKYRICERMRMDELISNTEYAVDSLQVNSLYVYFGQNTRLIYY
jgi:hypothetical protein